VNPKAVKAPTLAIPAGLAPRAKSGNPFRNILVAIDFSKASLRALSEALILAQQSGGHLRLLHVLDGSLYGSVYSGSRAFRLMHDFRARVARVNGELRALIPTDALNRADIDVATVSGKAHEAIVAAASERPTDLIVLGLPRRSRLEQIAAGSTVQRILRDATAPVLLVPGPRVANLSRPAGKRSLVNTI
jgi:nucleotide-binding universal stress UspA family protein